MNVMTKASGTQGRVRKYLQEKDDILGAIRSRFGAYANLAAKEALGWVLANDPADMTKPLALAAAMALAWPEYHGKIKGFRGTSDLVERRDRFVSLSGISAMHCTFMEGLTQATVSAVTFELVVPAWEGAIHRCFGAELGLEQCTAVWRRDRVTQVSVAGDVLDCHDLRYYREHFDEAWQMPKTWYAMLAA